MEKILFLAGEEMTNSQMGGCSLPPKQEALQIESVTISLLSWDGSIWYSQWWSRIPCYWQSPFCFRGKTQKRQVTQRLGQELDFIWPFLIKVRSVLLSSTLDQTPISTLNIFLHQISFQDSYIAWYYSSQKEHNLVNGCREERAWKQQSCLIAF